MAQDLAFIGDIISPNLEPKFHLEVIGKHKSEKIICFLCTEEFIKLLG